MELIIKLLVNAVAVFVFGYMLKGVEVKGFGTAVWVAILLALVNAFVRPVVLFLTIPFTIITFGLFILVVNTLMVMLVDWIVDGLQIKNFWWALLFSVLMSLVNVLFF
ncbi:MAG: phage holin family protein [Balneolaceae bacterium]|nr:phage holin family protein [Balneolaceae bacterium]